MSRDPCSRSDKDSVSHVPGSYSIVPSHSPVQSLSWGELRIRWLIWAGTVPIVIALLWLCLARDRIPVVVLVVAWFLFFFRTAI